MTTRGKLLLVLMPIYIVMLVSLWLWSRNVKLILLVVIMPTASVICIRFIRYFGG